MKEALTARQISLQARYVLPVTSDALDNARVLIEGETIKEVTECANMSGSQHGDVRDYGNAIVVSGFINLHCHLDYSRLRYLNASESLLPWVRRLIAGARSWTPDGWRESGLYGAREAALAGTSFIVDSSYTGSAAHAIAKTGLKGLVGLELFGLNPSSAGVQFDHWQKRLRTLAESPDSALKHALAEQRVTLTCAPHAPYTVCPELWSEANQWCKDRKVKLLAHVAESDVECSWLAAGNQEMNDHLIKVMEARIEPEVRQVLSDARWLGQGRSPVGHLHHFGLLDSNLLAAHAVHVSDDDLHLLKENRVTVAHCPRSNARLKNGIAPVAKMQREGVVFGLGTDSLASCDDLDLLGEARFADGLHRVAADAPHLNAREMVSLITIEAARALGLSDSIGSIEPGKRADLAVFTFDGAGPQPSDPYELLLRGPVKLKDLYVDGRLVVFNGANC